MYKLKYYCDFYSVEGNLYRIEIQEDTNNSLTAEEVKLIADSATIEIGRASCRERVYALV